MDQKHVKQRIKILKKVNIFSETSEDILGAIASRVDELVIQSGETVIYKGEQGHAMYMIIKGKVMVHDGDHVFSHLTDGMVFGEYSVIDTEVRSASVTGVDQTRVYRFDQEDYYNLLSENIGFARGVLKVLTARLRQHDVVQEQLARSNSRIKKQNEEIEQINQELVGLNKEKDHLIDILAHDLRNPLTSSISLVDLIKQEALGDKLELVEMTDKILSSLWRMNNMISRILEVRGIETKSVPLNFEKIDLGSLLREIHDHYQPVATNKSIQLHLKADRSYADLDEGYARQIFENLISNAIKFSPPETNVFILLTEQNGSWITEVRDEGPGLTKEDRAKLFGKFQRLSAEPTAGESSIGLGLSIVKRYVDEMEGQVWCESEKGGGARFLVSFPKVHS